MEPIVQFSKIIKKNTADFTAYDINKYIDWLWSRNDKKGEKTMNKNNNDKQITLTLTLDELKALTYAVHRIIVDADVNDEYNKALVDMYKTFKDFIKKEK